MSRFCPPPRRLLVLVMMMTLLAPLVLATPVARALPSPPVLFTPGDGSTTTAQYNSYPPTGTPTLVWLPCEGADRYTVQICPSAGCANPMVTQETRSTRYAHKEALADGTWYWRVRCCVYGEWSDYSNTFSFTKSWLDNGALAPQLLQPLADETVYFFEYPIFSWTPVIGAAYYRFRIASESTCSNIVYEGRTIKNTHTPASRRVRGDYYWQVIPVDHRNHESSIGECRHFFMDYQETPSLLAPDDYSHQTFTPEFRWTAVKGAAKYRLEVSTVPDFSSAVLTIETTNTRYTPQANLENDKEYYWRVAAIDSANTRGPWNPAFPNTRRFYMEWHLVPRLLSPTNNYVSAPFPVFQWTPVAGAKKYRIECDEDPSFGTPKWVAEVADPRYDHLDWGQIIVGAPYYWRVRAQDNRGWITPWSQTFSFDYSWTAGPTLVYPPYYYDPSVEPSTQPLDVRSDPTVPVPVFTWDRVVHPVGDVQQHADSYRIEVDDDFNFASVDWTTRTANLAIAPTVENGFDLTSGLYYWRVQAFRGGVPMGPYSEVWPMRFDTTLQGYTATLALYFPADGQDSVYDAPLFGWSPLQGVTQYDFQLATSPDFANIVDEARPIYSFYAPQQHLEPETYYWRVGVGGNWTQPRRLVITHPLRWGDSWGTGNNLLTHPIMYDNYTHVGDDQAGDAAAEYDLTGLYLAREFGDWYLTLDLPITNSTDMYFVIYVDVDHQEDSGGTTDPRGFNVQAAAINRPERVLFAHHNAAGAIDAVKLYRWSGSSWGPEEDLLVIGGDYTYQRGQYLELKIPLTVFPQDENWLGTVSLEAFTAPYGGQAYDTVPGETGAGPFGNLTNFTAVADKVNPLYPWNNPFNNPYVLQQNLALSFAKPIGCSYVAGFRVQVARDFPFTNLLREEVWGSASPPQYWFLGTRWTWRETFEENNTLYWRARSVHSGISGSGPWSQPMRFTKENYVPQTMSEEYVYATPTFRWDRIEGASHYLIEIDNDPEFGTPNYGGITDNNSYTPISGIADGTWHWRVRVYDGSSRPSNTAPSRTFVKASEVPTMLSPIGGVVVNEIPTFRWQGLLDSVMSSPKYRLFLDDDPSFSFPYLKTLDLDTLSTTPQWDLKLEDGFYYWKVAMLDGSGNPGPTSAYESFYKAYLRPTLLSASFDPSPDLQWGPIAGAAYYQVQICRDAAYANCVEVNTTTDQTRYISPHEYAPANYYWRVRMCDNIGACGPFYEDRVGPSGLVYLPVVAKY